MCRLSFPFKWHIVEDMKGKAVLCHKKKAIKPLATICGVRRSFPLQADRWNMEERTH